MQEFSYSAPLMGTELEVVIINKTPLDSLWQQILCFGNRIERQFSRFLSSSELSQLNLRRSQKASALMLSLLNVADDLYQQTNGVFNPLLSPVHLGYTADFNTYGNSFVATANCFNKNFSELLIQNQTIKLAPNQMLDFGGFLKGWTAENMSFMAKEAKGIIVNLGGDIYVAGSDVLSRNFTLEIDNPVEPLEAVRVCLKNQALATSGVYKRKWKGQHHIIDGATKNSSGSDLVSASVISDCGAQADALATMAIVLGSFKAKKQLDALGLRYVLIKKNGEIISFL